MYSTRIPRRGAHEIDEPRDFLLHGGSVRLRDDWLELLGEIRTFGPVLTVTRNRYAVIGRLGMLPELRASASGLGAGDCLGEFDYEFGYWSEAWASCVPQEDGTRRCMVDFVDHEGGVHHRMVLTSVGSAGCFARWVISNRKQDCGELAATHPRNPAQTLGSAEAPLSSLEPRVIERLLAACVHASLPLRLIVGNNATVQGHGIFPQQVQRQSQWLFVAGGEVGVHLRVDRGECALVVQESAQGSFLVVKLYEPEGFLATVVAPAIDADLAAWNAMVGAALFGVAD